ncbi:TIM barrel protein [Methylobacterium sp.]|uniref:sugar phosphate isomerase/epimerase family protein n=1 Tax=Methylobacterium sp. TaxID=409 RepID=UPI00262AAA31|nr:TIM barrel protein [Methylobacterium sp.]MDB5648436.1 Xylose isomerase domain protein barrel [Methylobacterium sp.]
MIRGRNFALSNLCWPMEQDRAALRLLRDLGYRGLEIAPFKVFGGWENVTRAEVATYRRGAESEGLAVIALQGILFGAQLGPIFSGARARASLLTHATHVARMAGDFGGLPCVFGAPGLRRLLDVPVAEADRIATGLFRDLGAIFADHGSILVLEANPERYGCEYVTRTDEAAALVAAVDHWGFRLHVDTGTLCVNGERDETLGPHLDVAAHVHVSEPDLVPLSPANPRHRQFGERLRSSAYTGWISVEMKQSDGDWRTCLQRSAQVIEDHYDVKADR